MKKLKPITLIIYIMFLIIIFDIVATIGYAENITQYFYDGQWHEYTYAPTYINVNGENLNTDVPPIIFNDRSVVPARAVFEKLGAKVLWDSENQTVEISMDDILIILTIDEKNAIVNNITHEMDIPPKIINSRTMIPVGLSVKLLVWKWAESLLKAYYYQ